MSEPADRFFTGRLRVLQYISLVSVLFECAVFAVLVGTHWAWGPFIVAGLLFAGAAAVNATMLRIVIRWFKPSAEHLGRAAGRRRQRNTVVLPGYIIFALAFGLIAGSLRSYWPDVAVGVMILVISVLLPLALLPAIKRRASQQRSVPPDAT